MDKLVGMRLRCLANSPRLSSGLLHRQALRAVGAGPDGSGAFMSDVGAHVGETSVALSLEFPKAVIHAFEPVEAIFKQLQKNCRKYYDPTYRPESGRLDFTNFLFTLKEE